MSNLEITRIYALSYASDQMKAGQRYLLVKENITKQSTLLALVHWPCLWVALHCRKALATEPWRKITGSAQCWRIFSQFECIDSKPRSNMEQPIYRVRRGRCPICGLTCGTFLQCIANRCGAYWCPASTSIWKYGFQSIQYRLPEPRREESLSYQIIRNNWCFSLGQFCNFSSTCNGHFICQCVLLWLHFRKLSRYLVHR